MDDIQLYWCMFGAILAIYPLLWFAKITHLDIGVIRPVHEALIWPAYAGLLRLAYSGLRLLPSLPFYVRYSLALPRRYWMSVTKLEALVLAFHLGSNAVLLYRARANLQSRAATLAAVNTVPLFLGGHTNILADRLGVPLSTYYVFHHFLGRVVIIEGLLHASLLLARSRWNPTTISGYIAAGALLASFCTSFFIIRRYLRKYFAGLHLLCSLTALAGLSWHVTNKSTTSQVLIYLSGGIWTCSTAYRILRLIRGTAATVTEADSASDSKISKITLTFDTQLRIAPGNYFYLYLPGTVFHYNLFNSYPLIVFWFKPGPLVAEPNVVKCITLISHRGHHSGPLRLTEHQKVRLDGPYGYDIDTRDFHTIQLAAKGVGIIGVLSFALSRLLDPIPELRLYIFWELEHHLQGLWVAKQFKQLRDMDKEGKLSVWCLYPSAKRGRRSLFREDKKKMKWLCLNRDAEENPDDFLRKMISQRRSKKAIVIACGDPDFTSHVCKETISLSGPSGPIAFAELQYRPPMSQEWDAESGDAENGDAENEEFTDVPLTPMAPDRSNTAVKGRGRKRD